MVKLKFKDLTEEDLKDLAKKITKCLKGNEIFLLEGNLGAGKTTFVRYVAEAIDKDLKNQVNSPTFVIMNVYETEKFNIYHVDLYRVKDFDLTDFIGSGVIFIEWPNVDEFLDLDLPVVYIKFFIDKDINKRDVEIEIYNGDYISDCLGK